MAYKKGYTSVKAAVASNTKTRTQNKNEANKRINQDLP